MVSIAGRRFYTIDETAAFLGITSRTLYRWQSEPDSRPEYFLDFEPITTPRGRKLYKEEDILSMATRCLKIDISKESIDELRQLATI